MSNLIPKDIRSKNLRQISPDEEEIPLSIRLIRIEAALAQGDINLLIQHLGCSEADFAKLVVVVAMNDAKPKTDSTKLDDKVMCKKYMRGKEMILFGLRNNPEYQNVFTSIVKSQQVKARYADILEGVVTDAIKGNSKSAEFVLSHAGLHEKDTKNTNTQVNIYSDYWKNQIGDIIDQPPTNYASKDKN